MRRLRIFGLVFACATVAVTLSSCSGNGLAKVKGKVIYDGKPAAGAVVVFHPVDEPKGKPIPTGVVGPDGTFQLTTFGLGDGAPPGRYSVTVSWTKNERELDPTSDEKGDVLIIPERYLSVEKSGLYAEVNPGKNEVGPFILKPDEPIEN